MTEQAKPRIRSWKHVPSVRKGWRGLRSSYFACGETATRYGVGFDRVVKHLWVARSAERHLLLRSVKCMDDLLQAVACVDQCNLAWSDLAECYERALVRKCLARHDEMAAVMLVRRLMTTLRRRTAGPMVVQVPCMRCYTGTRPMRVWLTERLNASLAQPADSEVTSESRILELRPGRAATGERRSLPPEQTPTAEPATDGVSA